ncbi:Flagellar protein, partial [Globisporangium splendens]
MPLVKEPRPIGLYTHAHKKMSELLLAWLNHDLQLSTYVTDLERDFASGYLLGEIPFHLNQLHNFSDFVNSNIADTKIINFCLLEPSLRNMSVKLDATLATAIMNGKKGAAANLLYQIKMTAERIRHAPEVSTKSLERNAILPLHNMPTTLVKPTYDAGNHASFERSIRQHVKSLATLKREKDGIADEEKKRHVYLRRQAKIRDQLEITKAERLHKAFIHSHFIKEALEETNSPAWRIALEKKNAREHRKAVFYQQLLAHRVKQQNRRGGAKSTARGSNFPSRKSVDYGLRSLSTTLEKVDSKTVASLLSPGSRQATERPMDRADLVQDLNSIKEQKQQRDKRKEQLERRRKRFVQDCGKYHAQLSSARASMTLETLVARETNSEKDVRKNIDDVLVFKEIARENRELRLAEYAKQREADSAAAVERDASIYGRLVLRYDDDVEMQIMHKHHFEVATSASQRYLNELIAASIMQDLVDFTVFVAGKREETLYARSPAIFVPQETWTEYKVQFAYGHPLLGEDAASSGMETSSDQLLSHFQLDQYLASFLPLSHITMDYVGSSAKGTALSPWCPRDTLFIGAVKVLEDRYVLGEEVKYIRWIRQTVTLSTGSSGGSPEATAIEDQSERSTSLEPPENSAVETTVANDGDQQDTLPVLEDAPVVETIPQVKSAEPSPRLLRILVFGSPFTGKKLHAARLAEKYELTLISVHQLVDDAIQKQSEIGLEIQQLLSSGSEIPPRMYSQLVFDAVQTLMSSPDRSPAGEGEERHEVVQSGRKGWIVYDLPSTEAQARNLEELLTGFVDPELIPSPFDLESRIAPGCVKPKLPSSFLHGKSGVDLVFYLDCTCETAMERCLGQVEDEATHEKFHLVYNKPSEDSTERHRLSHMNPSVNCSELLSLQCVTSDEFAQSQKPWYKKFDTLREVSTSNSSVDEIHEQMAGFVDRFYKDQDETDQSRQQDQEDAELELMRTEELHQLRMHELEHTIHAAEEEHSRCQHALHQAEESKAKKEEVAELRHALDVAQKQVDAATSSAAVLIRQERARADRDAEKFSGRLLPQLSSVLAGAWDDMEHEYVIMMAKAFDLQREQRKRTSDRTSRIIKQFCEFLRRPDAKQSHVNQFQELFNQVIDEMRFDEATKLELHVRTDILQDELMDVVEAKTAENEDEPNGITTGGWLEDTCQCVAITFQAALQTECDRFLVSVQLLVDGFAAASMMPSSTTAAVENLKANPALLDLSCRVFFDAAAEEAAAAVVVPVVAAATPAASTGKAAATKGKGKAAAPAPAAPARAPSVHDLIKESGDPMAMDELLASYEKMLQKCDALAHLVLSKVDNGSAEHHKTGTSDPSSSNELANVSPADPCVTNLAKGIQYEHGLMQRRIRFLRDAMHRDDVAGRHRRAEAARKRRDLGLDQVHSIEAKVNLPYFINVKPESVYRFPITIQLRDDTFVNVDSTTRLVPPPAADPPPIVGERYGFLLNPRQIQKVKELLASGTSADGGGRASLFVLVDIMTSLNSTPLLPRLLRGCTPHLFAKIGRQCMDPATSLVSVDAFLAALSNDEASIQLLLDEQVVVNPADQAEATESSDSEAADT